MRLVTVICLCYNQGKYIEDAIESVFAQTYPHIELIVVDDGSTDNSVEIIQGLYKKYPSIVFINNKENRGMCKSFNHALSISNGEFIIDLAADDIMLPERVSTQVEAFKLLNDTYGVVFSDAFIVNEKKEFVKTFYKRNSLGTLMETVSEGNIFKDVVHSYKICSPTIMVRKEVLEHLGGYDEKLSYEDYDFFIRSSRIYKYHYIDKPLLYKRELGKSASGMFYDFKVNRHLESTLIICQKALWLCENDGERKALLHSVRYHFRQSYYLNNYDLAFKFYDLICEMGFDESKSDRLVLFLLKLKISVYPLYKVYLTILRRYT